MAVLTIKNHYKIVLKLKIFEKGILTIPLNYATLWIVLIIGESV